MTYSSLKDDIASYAHRSDLSAQIPGFVEIAEGMIRRDVREFPTSVTLDEDDRISGGLYQLPAQVQVRAVYIDDKVLDHVGVSEIKIAPTSMDPRQYFVEGSTIEFRGVPATDTEIVVRYHGLPAALSADDDTNDILTLHQGIYLFGSLFALYQFTQDLELAENMLALYQQAVDTFNASNARQSGGARMRSVYAFGPRAGGY